MSAQDGEKVRVDAENDGGTAELQTADPNLAEAEDGTTESHGEMWVGGGVKGWWDENLDRRRGFEVDDRLVACGMKER